MSRMNFFDKASKTNKLISAIDKKIYLLDIERNNTSSEWESYFFLPYTFKLGKRFFVGRMEQKKIVMVSFL